MKNLFSEKYMLCSQCQYVGRFLAEQKINESKWLSNPKHQWLNHSDYACPKCSTPTTTAAQIDYHEITEIAYNALNKETK